MSGDSKTSAAMEIADKIDSNDAKAVDIELQILATMRSRATYLREKSDSLTLESVRRLLEKDMKLEKHALDVHKSFVKQHLVECLEGVEDEGTSENSQETEKKDDATPVKEEAKLSQEHKAEKDAKEDTNGDDEKMKDSPVMGLLTEENTSKSVAEESKQVLKSDIKKALRKRSSYIKANSEKITMGILRRLLEQDLKLEKFSLDIHKKFISEELEEVLQAFEATKPSAESKRKNLTKKVKSTSAKELDSEDEMSDSDGEDEEEDDKEVAVKKKTALSKSEGTGKRKREKEKVAFAKKTKQADSESDSDEGNNVSSSSVKKQQPATPVYGKRVEKLKAVIKSCGMSVPPSVYKKVKQAPEKKREDTLIKELEEILTKEGLSSSPSEKEIKEVKKRKQITKELEGIDTSNIVSSSRRRSSAGFFVPPPKPKIVEESESDESEDSENEEDDDEEVEEDEEGEGEDEEGEGEVEDEQKGGNEDSG
ncbi:unnamed protein product [Microthlaspi erraticum]|uniref:DEK-C domain-containing protein n=1 Tax=Microthlaspi erraticum TaxID=1685480 RepID=A0A6D2HTV4_9BRAS|nr:unnamed protein product [Microthlaspi erraticum]